MVNYYKICFVVDNGYEWNKEVCVIEAHSIREVIAKFNNYALGVLKGEEYIRHEHTTIDLILTNDNDIIYSSFRNPCNIRRDIDNDKK